jgi:lipooligosaccharide transport system ATP-binding protein
VARETSPQVIEVFDPSAQEATAIRDLEGLADRVERLADRWLLYTGDGESLLSKVRVVKGDPGSVWLRGATLEDVFLQLTGRGLLE